MTTITKELPFIKKINSNESFFWSVNNPCKHNEGVKNATILHKYIQDNPHMVGANLLIRIVKDLNDSGLINSESAKGFFYKLESLLSCKNIATNNKRVDKTHTIPEMAKKFKISNFALLDNLSKLAWINSIDMSINYQAKNSKLLEECNESPFGLKFTQTGKQIFEEKQRLIFS